MADRSLKTSGTIRGKIVWGYTGIYCIIALITAVMLFFACYFIIFQESQQIVRGQLEEILLEVPQDASKDEIYELLETRKPSYVERYDLYLIQEVAVPYSESEAFIEPEEPEDMQELSQYGQPTLPPDHVQDDGTDDSGLNQYSMPTQPPEQLPGVIATYYSAGQLNVRSGPSTDYDIIATLHGNHLVDIADMSGEWFQIIYAGQVAWVYGPYLMSHPLTNVESTHLLSSAGVDVSYQNSFDYNQMGTPFDNLKDLSRLYTQANNITYQYSEEYRYELLHYYSIEAVTNMQELIWQTQMNNRLMELSVVAFIFFLAFIIGLVIIIIYGASKTRKFLRPIEDITNLVSQINEGNLNNRIDVESARYELKELVITINGMLDRVHAGYAKQKMFVSDVSHELRTPISVVAGYANMLKRWAKDDQAVFDESVQAIIEEADNMKYLVDNLLFLVRSDNNTISYDMERFNLSELMHDVYKSSLLIDNNKHTITEDIKDDVFIEGDRARIKQAARIFIENAVKYTPPTGEIKLALKKDGHTAVITVADNGIGISKKDMAHIFKRFYRGDKSRNRQAGGYGLGLPIARSIIAAHRGKIHLRSKENRGTIVDIVLNA